MNLDQVDVVNDPNLTGKPMEELTECSEDIIPHSWFCYLNISPAYHLYRIELKRLCGRMWDQCFGIALPTYREILDLDEQLSKFELELPFSFRHQTTQMAAARPYLTYQVCVLFNLRDDIYGPTPSIER
jgi:hypothetical protein